MAPLSSALSALKRLVEAHLREKDQAADMLKGYVTTITREVGVRDSRVVLAERRPRAGVVSRQKLVPRMYIVRA